MDTNTKAIGLIKLSWEEEARQVWRVRDTAIGNSKQTIYNNTK